MSNHEHMVWELAGMVKYYAGEKLSGREALAALAKLGAKADAIDAAREAYLVALDADMLERKLARMAAGSTPGGGK